jgi:transcriptional regulator GlxA family with amidase domain
MRDTVYVLVFDGFADWQAALALCEVRRPGDWQVRTLGFSHAPVVSMGGLTVQPDAALAELAPDRAVLLIVPGGHLWLRGEGAVAVERLREAHAAGATVAGIDTGVVPLAAPACSTACATPATGPASWIPCPAMPAKTSTTPTCWRPTTAA